MLGDLVKVWSGRGEYEVAEKAIRFALPKARKELGSDHEYVARLQTQLAELHRLQATQ